MLPAKVAIPMKFCWCRFLMHTFIHHYYILAPPAPMYVHILSRTCHFTYRQTHTQTQGHTWTQTQTHILSLQTGHTHMDTHRHRYTNSLSLSLSLALFPSLSLTYTPWIQIHILPFVMIITNMYKASNSAIGGLTTSITNAVHIYKYELKKTHIYI